MTRSLPLLALALCGCSSPADDSTTSGAVESSVATPDGGHIPYGPSCDIFDPDGNPVAYAYMNRNSVFAAGHPQRFLGAFKETPWRAGYVYDAQDRPVAYIRGAAAQGGIEIYSVTDDTSPPSVLIGNIGYEGGMLGGEYGTISNATGNKLGIIGGRQCRPFRGQDLADRNIAAAGAFFAFFSEK